MPMTRGWEGEIKRLCWVALVFALACSETADQGAQSGAAVIDAGAVTVPASLREDVIRELVHQTSGWTPRVRVTPDDVTFNAVHSRSVADLSYFRAKYTSVIDHGILVLYAGVRGDRHLILADPSSWAALVTGWNPVDKPQALQACVEMVTMNQRGNEILARGLVSDSAVLQEFIGASDYRRRVAADAREPNSVVAPSTSAGSWVIRAWFVTPTLTRLATRFECRFPLAGPASATVLDSITKFGI